MKKFLRFIIVLTSLAVIVLGLLIYMNYYNIHVLAQSFEPSDNFGDANTPYHFELVSCEVKLGEWTDASATLYITVRNTGTAATANYCPVTITAVDFSSKEPVMIAAECDTRNWAPGLTTIEFPLNLKSLGFNHYNMYFKVWDEQNSCDIIMNNRLLNSADGYFIGSLGISHFF